MLKIYVEMNISLPLHIYNIITIFPIEFSNENVFRFTLFGILYKFHVAENTSLDDSDAQDHPKWLPH